jgi:hypothetical protein
MATSGYCVGSARAQPDAPRPAFGTARSIDEPQEVAARTHAGKRARSTRPSAMTDPVAGWKDILQRTHRQVGEVWNSACSPFTIRIADRSRSVRGPKATQCGSRRLRQVKLSD